MLYIPFPLKFCNGCKRYFPSTRKFFSLHPDSKDKLQAQCRFCSQERARKWRANNPDKARESVAKYRIEHAVKARERSRQWREENPDRYKAAQKRYSQSEGKRKSRQKYAKTHREKCRVSEHRHRVKKRELPRDFTIKDWQRTLEYFHGACAYCGKGASLFDAHWILHQEHHIPVAKGGGYTVSNIIPACQSCNLSKAGQDPSLWILKRFGKRKASTVLKRIQTYFEWVQLNPFP